MYLVNILCGRVETDEMKVPALNPAEQFHFGVRMFACVTECQK